MLGCAQAYVNVCELGGLRCVHQRTHAWAAQSMQQQGGMSACSPALSGALSSCIAAQLQLQLCAMPSLGRAAAALCYVEPQEGSSRGRGSK